MIVWIVRLLLTVHFIHNVLLLRGMKILLGSKLLWLKNIGWHGESFLLVVVWGWFCLEKAIRANGFLSRLGNEFNTFTFRKKLTHSLALLRSFHIVNVRGVQNSLLKFLLLILSDLCPGYLLWTFSRSIVRISLLWSILLWGSHCTHDISLLHWRWAL